MHIPPAEPVPVTLHPLDPLASEEVRLAVRVVREQIGIKQKLRFISVNLREPVKDEVLVFTPGQPYERQASLILINSPEGVTYEIVVSITSQRIVSCQRVTGVHPAIVPDECADCEQVVKSDPRFRDALRKRGVTDFDLVMVDTWSVGNYAAKPEFRRLARALSWIRAHPTDNGYAHPIDGLFAIVDLNKLEVIEIEDNGITPIPVQPANYRHGMTDVQRESPKPLTIVQPQGPSFTVEGYKVRWQNWHLRIGFTTREGLVLHEVAYEDKGSIRPVLYRASLAEMVVPYGDPGINHFRKNAFDAGEYGLGMDTNSLKVGCDCLGYIHYFDAMMADSRGDLLKIPNAVCMHEEDYGILWKHFDWRTDHTEVRRSRRLVISFMVTIANYQYGFFWYFYQDGTIQFEVKLTGIMNCGVLPSGARSRYGQLVAPQVYAPIHQHVFNVRLHMMVDGQTNSVYEVNTEAEPPGPDNFCGNAFFAKSTLLESESQAKRSINPFTCRFWKIVNPTKYNYLGEPVAYKLMPGENAPVFAHPESSVMKRAGFALNHLWVTPYRPEERFPAGDYPNQHVGGEGLPSWTRADRSIANTDVVLWYTMVANHVPRIEDWPVMPAAYIGFSVKPAGFFDRNPAIDIPPTSSAHEGCSTAQQTMD
jgi:primary-amine oxidase